MACGLNLIYSEHYLQPYLHHYIQHYLQQWICGLLANSKLSKRAGLNGYKVFVDKDCRWFPEHSLDDLMRRDSSSPGECSTDFSHVVGLGKDSGVCLVDGCNQKHGDCALVHLPFCLRVDEDRVFSPRFWDKELVVQIIHGAQTVRRLVRVEECTNHNVGRSAIHSLVFIKKTRVDC